MRYFINCCISIIVVSINISAQKWIWRNPLPHGAQFVDVITKGDTVFASTKFEVFSFSSDAGRTWEVRTHDSIQEGGKMAFMDESTIVMSLRNGRIALTSDWGKNWKLITYRSESPYIPSDAPFVKFFDPQNGIIISLGAPIYIWQTTDKGLSWNEKELQYYGYSISFISDHELFIGASNNDTLTNQRTAKLLFSGNKLQTWKEINTLPSGITKVISVLFESKSKGMILTDNGLYYTIDGGATWISVSTLAYNLNYAQLEYDELNGNYYLIHGYYDYSISRSTDGGNSWTPILYNIPDGSLIKNMHIDTRSILYAYGDGGAMYQSSDHGIVWNRIHGIGPTFQLTSIHFSNLKNGVVFSSGNRYLVTSNGGTTWDERLLSGDNQFEENDFYSDESGYALTRNRGSAYFFLSTSDGGFTWDSVSQIPVQKYFITGVGRPTVIKAVGQGRVWIGAQFGTMYQTTDNGKTWNVHYVFPDYLSYNGDQSLFALDDAHVWFTQAHLLSISSDSMKSFVVVDPTSLKYFQPVMMNIYFLNSQDGWMSGRWGGSEFLLRSNNAGEDWEIVQGIGGRRMSFVNDKLALLYGQSTDYYPIYITEDGWNSWVSYRSQYNSMMSGMLLVDKNTCWGVGANGMIMEFKR